MPAPDAARLRLASQRLARPLASPAAVVAWMGAVQAQDRAAALWAIGLRTERAKAADVERAFDRGEVVRTWPMRGTLHVVPAKEAHAMVALLAPRALRRAASRERELRLTDRVLERSRGVLARALEGGHRLTRPEAYQLLDAAGIATRGQRGVHILGHLAQEGLLCLGPMEGKQSTLVLLDEWARPPKERAPRAQALTSLAATYVRGHGPASAQDFAWWCGQPVGEARAALEGARGLRERDGLWTASRPRPAAREGRAHLLPAFDEMLVGYKDRSASLARIPPRRVPPSAGLLSPVVVVDGQVVGRWTRKQGPKGIALTARWLVPLDAAEREAVARAAERYGAFHGVKVELAEGT